MAATTTPALKLNNGVEMPALGLGVFQTPARGDHAPPSSAALRRRLPPHRHRRRLRQRARGRRGGRRLRPRPLRGLPRDEDLDLRLRLRRDAARVREERRQARRRADRPADPPPGAALGVRPDPRGLPGAETLLADGKVRAIGVSNFMVDHLTALLDRAEVVPAVNQIELHPYFAQAEVQAFGARARHPRRRRGRRSAASRSTATAATPPRSRTR